MKRTKSNPWMALMAAGLGCTLILGCGDSGDPSGPSQGNTPAGNTTGSTSTAPIKVVSPPAQAKIKPALLEAQKELANLTKQLETSLTAKPDPVLSGLAKDFTGKVEGLTEALAPTPTLQTYVDSVVKNLTSKRDPQALGVVEKLSKVKLTPEQTKLVSELRNITSAFVVQRNFASLEGAEGPVGKAVGALREGNIGTALAEVKQIAGNANLTDEQKTLVNSLMEQYAPGLKDAGKALQQNVKGLNPFNK